MRHHNDGGGHFKWCPSQKEGRFTTCLCQIAIYLVLALVGGIAAYVEYQLGVFGSAHAPRGDAWHLAGDTAGSVVAGVVAAVATTIRRIHDRVRIIGGYIQAMFLVAAAVAIGFEVVESVHDDSVPNAMLMVMAGLVGVVGNLLRLMIIHINKGGWDLNRLGEWFHIFVDLAGSVVVVGAGLVIMKTGLGGWDVAATPVIFVLVVVFAIVMFRKAWRGEVEVH